MDRKTPSAPTRILWRDGWISGGYADLGDMEDELKLPVSNCGSVISFGFEFSRYFDIMTISILFHAIPTFSI